MSIAVSLTAQQWADRIHEHATAAVASFTENTVAAGRELIAAKKALQHGQWERMFAGHPEAVKRPIPFSVRTAQRIMAVARHPVLSKGTHVCLLPSSWGMLYELTKLDDAVLRQALADGRIRPDMERREALALRGRTNGQPEPHDPTFDGVGVQVDELESRLSELYSKAFYRFRSNVWKRDEKVTFVASVRQVADELERLIPPEEEPA